MIYVVGSRTSAVNLVASRLNHVVGLGHIGSGSRHCGSRPHSQWTFHVKAFVRRIRQLVKMLMEHKIFKMARERELCRLCTTPADHACASNKMIQAYISLTSDIKGKCNECVYMTMYGC